MAKAAERWRVEIAHAADADIREIDRWTERQFGAVQAEAYATAIANAIAALIAGPQIRGARPRTDMRRGLYTLHLSRFRRHARHFVVFRVSDPERRVIDVLRVLHDAIDLRAAFAERSVWRGGQKVTDSFPQVMLPDGDKVPAFGQGTWHMGEDRRRAAEEAAALRLGIELGLTLIDTAEMYGSGRAEEIVADASKDLRDRLFIVSKVLPYNASRNGVIEACERSLKRLNTDRIDLYLLHWRGSAPLAETLAGFERLKRDGKIRHHGVSNFDRGDMEEWAELTGGQSVAANQILYNLTRRGPEWELIPWCRERKIAIMAYTPIEQGRMLRHKALAEVAARHDATPAQVALAWLLRQDGIIVIPKASQQEHVRENRGALDVELTAEDVAALDHAFPPPKGRTALGML